MIVTLTVEKMDDLAKIIDKALRDDRKQGNTIRFISKVIGKIVASLHGSLEGALHYRFLEANKNMALSLNSGNYDATMTLTLFAKEDLAWWRKNVKKTYAPIQWPAISQEIATDASSLIGWGAVFGCAEQNGLY